MYFSLLKTALMKKYLGLWILILLTPLFIFLKKKPKDNRPNIIVILADDMGFSDVGCYGGEVHTPNIDYMAANGLRYTQFYNMSRCCPTRASLLTGQYNHEAGIGNMTDDEDAPGYRGFLTDNTVTLAEVLKQAGYHTGMAGKWHVSNTDGLPDKDEQLKWLNHQAYHDKFSPLEQYPTNRGFEKFYGTIWGVVDYFDPFSLVNGTTPVKEVPKDYYHTDAINDTAASYIRQFSKDNQPFFLYIAENAPHWPLMALPEDIKKYKDTYKVGWDSIRAARYRRMQKLGIINAPLSPRWKAEEQSWANNPNKDFDAAAMAVHAAMIDRMDQGLSRIIKALKETGRLDNTLIVFLSDNGASAENAPGYGPGFDRPSQTRDGREIIYKKAMPGPETAYTSIGANWANVSNTPFKLWKSESYEGGIHTPMIAFWPAGIKAKGKLTNQLGHVKDFMATFVALSGATYPSQFRGHTITPMQGKSLLPSFQMKPATQQEALFNEHYGARYVRYDGWKLVSRSQDSTWHLYHIDQDQTELKDLATQYPERVQSMTGMWYNWANSNKVFPKPKK
jgi:arylsulfatase A-like enzyme